MARLKWGRVFAAMLVLSGTIFAVDGLRRDLFKSNTNSITVVGDFVNGNSVEKDNSKQIDGQIYLGNESQSTTVFEGVQNLGFSELSVSPSLLSSGKLVIINDEYPAGESTPSGMINLLKYKNDYYNVLNESVKLNEEAAEALNHMMADYHEATGLTDFIVYGTNDTFTGDGSCCPEYFPESITGNTIDLALNAYGGIIAFDGLDEEGWIVKNCEKYGYIVRYPEGKESQTGHKFCPWHLRYVGDVHAAIMSEKDYSLEEYINFLKNYSYDNVYSYVCNGIEYEIYTSSAIGDVASARVPISGNYSVSGDNIGTYIITTVKN